jgi:hypothetical protein
MNDPSSISKPKLITTEDWWLPYYPLRSNSLSLLRLCASVLFHYLIRYTEDMLSLVVFEKSHLLASADE